MPSHPGRTGLSTPWPGRQVHRWPRRGGEAKVAPGCDFVVQLEDDLWAEVLPSRRVLHHVRVELKPGPGRRRDRCRAACRASLILTISRPAAVLLLT
jgi:hypothetical protein